MAEEVKVKEVEGEVIEVDETEVTEAKEEEAVTVVTYNGYTEDEGNNLIAEAKAYKKAKRKAFLDKAKEKAKKGVKILGIAGGIVAGGAAILAVASANAKSEYMLDVADDDVETEDRNDEVEETEEVETCEE